MAENKENENHEEVSRREASLNREDAAVEGMKTMSWEDLQESLDMAKAAQEALKDKLGEDIDVLDIHEVSVLSDYFLIVTGRNTNHCHALADAVDEKMSLMGHPYDHIEGYREGKWILMDFGRIIVHVFRKDAREFYNLEHIWSDGKKVDLEDLK